MEEENSMSSERSGWTSYMEDFSYCSVVSHGGADSSVCRKWCSSTCNNGGAVKFCMEMEQRFEVYGLKRKMIEEEEGDELEDTATSAHTPISKVSYLNQMDLLSSKRKKQMERTQAKESEYEDRIEMGFVGRDSNCSIGLKNVGLCLVPVSMAVNYFG